MSIHLLFLTILLDNGSQFCHVSFYILLCNLIALIYVAHVSEQVGRIKALDYLFSVLFTAVIMSSA
jgi:hypothetical protein